jgi:hypothetical protein
MTPTATRISPTQVMIWLIVAITVIIAPIVGYQTSATSYQLVFLIIAGMLAFIWTIFAGHRWWVPFPAALAFGGTFYVGFKIPAHEMALMICIFPLLLNLCVRYSGAAPGRSRLSASILLLGFYLFFHWLGSISFNTIEALGGHGTVTRSYMNAMWPMILFFMFYFFGRTAYLREALALVYLAVLIRVGLGVWDYFEPGMRYIPGINFVLPAASAMSTGGSEDLRASCGQLCTIAICYLCLSKGFFRKSWFILNVIGSLIGLTLGGGRLSIISTLVIIFLSALLYRKFSLIFAIFVVTLSGVTLLNFNKSLIYDLPLRAQRSLSILIFEKGSVEAHDYTSLSDEWHDQLQKAGKDRWLESLTTILVGHGIRPFNERFRDESMGGMELFNYRLKVAIETATFESGLWTVLAVLGAVGLALYMNVFRFLLADSIPNLIRNKICDYNHAFYFLATVNIILWIIFCPASGTYPSSALMFALFAKTAHDDDLWMKRSQRAALPGSSSAFQPLPSLP